ncbi:hypothetical protein CTAYLR_004462 [Chrysophaeum taylorii]|uniref:GCK domain-containing protein n=1 Tax=Chrysophaeum taylorii TaxID=2483200 RepID=A0AAD7UDF2_9STRA|nr:hypothetical protein CTAYLR_004462 [Chrysophaeum taylorii]
MSGDSALAAGASTGSLDLDGEDCGFCLFMRAGPCGADFRSWEACVKAYQNEDFARKCMGATSKLTKCMQQNKDYYDLPGLNTDTANPTEKQHESGRRR